MSRHAGWFEVGFHNTPSDEALQAVSLADRVIQAIKGADAGPFNINFLTPFDHKEQARSCAEERVPAESFHWGHPKPATIKLLKEAGCTVWEQVGNIEDARRAVGDGVDVIVAQGQEAGGHN